jgi:hypothetical protein
MLMSVAAATRLEAWQRVSVLRDAPGRHLRDFDADTHSVRRLRRRRLAPEAVVSLGWHNDMSKLILDINDRIEAATDERARGDIVRRLRRALEAQD